MDSFLGDGESDPSIPFSLFLSFFLFFSRKERKEYDVIVE